LEKYNTVASYSAASFFAESFQASSFYEAQSNSYALLKLLVSDVLLYKFVTLLIIEVRNGALLVTLMKPFISNEFFPASGRCLGSR